MIKVPPNTCISNTRFINTDFANALRTAGAKVAFDETLDNRIDAVPMEGTALVIFREADLCSKSLDVNVKRVELAQSYWQGELYVIVHRTRMSVKEWEAFQLQMMLLRSVSALPVSDMVEAGTLVNAIMLGKSKHKAKPETALSDVVLQAFTNLPRVGEKKAKLLLQAYKSLDFLSRVTPEDIHRNVPSIGLNDARLICAYFDETGGDGGGGGKG